MVVLFKPSDPYRQNRNCSEHHFVTVADNTYKQEALQVRNHQISFPDHSIRFKTVSSVAALLTATMASMNYHYDEMSCSGYWLSRPQT